MVTSALTSVSTTASSPTQLPLLLDDGLPDVPVQPMRLDPIAVDIGTSAQIVELHGALEKIKDDNGCWNKGLKTVRLEQEATQTAGKKKAQR